MKKKTRYASVRELVETLSQDKEDKAFAEELEAHFARREMAKSLFVLRNVKGLSQANVAEKMGCTQSRVSKLENTPDGSWSLQDSAAYAAAIGLDLRFVFMKKGRMEPIL